MDMEHELRALRIQIREKCTISFKLQKEVNYALPFISPASFVIQNQQTDDFTLASSV